MDPYIILRRFHSHHEYVLQIHVSRVSVGVLPHNDDYISQMIQPQPIQHCNHIENHEVSQAFFRDSCFTMRSATRNSKVESFSLGYST